MTKQQTLPVPEFSRILEIDKIPAGGTTTKIAADAGELALLAKRLGLPAVHDLSAKITAEPWRKNGCRLKGVISADIEQQCVVTLNDFRNTATCDLQREFVADNPRRKPGVEVVVDPMTDDGPEIIQDGKIDMGEVVVETLALALEPYPRMPGAVFAEATPDDGEDQSASRPNPFAALGKLKLSE